MRFWIFLPLAFILAACATSERTAFLTVPPAVMCDTVDLKAYEEKYGKYNGVFLSIENTIEHAGNQSSYGIQTSWHYYYIIHRKYIVLNPDDESLTTFTLNTSNIKNVGNLFLQTTSPDGQFKRWSQKDLVLTKDPDGFVRYKFIYPRVVKGTIIEEGYELQYNALTHHPPLGHEIYLQYSIPCEHLQFSYAYPDWWTINIKRTADSLLRNYTTVHDSLHHKNILKAEVHNVPALVREPYAPYFKEVAQYLEFMVMNFHMGDYFFDRPSTWKSYVHQYQSYLLDRDGFLGVKVANTTDSLIRFITDPMKKLSTIITFLQDTITPVEDREDRDFADILKQRKGNIYAITGLAYSMLSKADLSPSYILIHSAKEGYFDSSFVSFDQFPIPAISVQLAKKSYIVFPYRKDLLLGQIQQDYQDQPALVLGAGGTYSLTNIFPGADIENKETEEYEISLSETGLTTVKETRTFYGMMGYEMRELLNSVKLEDQEKFFKKMFMYEEEDTKFLSHTIEHQKDYQQPLHVAVEYSIENLITITPDEVLFRTSGLLSPVTMKDYRVEDEDRYNPIDISFDEDIVKDVAIRYPQTWKLKTVLPNDSLGNRFGYLRSRSEQQEGMLHIQQHRHLKKNTAPKEQIKDLAALTGRKKENIVPTIIFSKNK